MACRLPPIFNEDDEEPEEEGQEDHKNCHDDFVPVCVMEGYVHHSSPMAPLNNTTSLIKTECDKTCISIFIATR